MLNGIASDYPRRNRIFSCNDRNTEAQKAGGKGSYVFFCKRSSPHFYSPVSGSLHFQATTAQGYHLTPEAEQTVMFTPDVAVIKLNMQRQKKKANSAFAVAVQVLPIGESTTTITRSPSVTTPTGAPSTAQAPQKHPLQTCRLTSKQGTSTLLLQEWLSAKQTDPDPPSRLAEASSTLGGGRQNQAPPRPASDFLATGYW